MPRPLKIILVIFGLLVATVVAVAIALPFLFDPNDYKQEIAALVEENTGREFTMAGDIELSVFPWLGVRIGESRLANAEGFGDQPLAQIDTVDARVKLIPLLSKQIEVGTVTLDGLRLRLARNASGETNWDSIVEKVSADKPAEEAAKKPEETEGGFSLPEFEIGAIEISDAAIFWQDATSDTSYELTNFKLSTGRLTLGEPFRLESSFMLADGSGATARTSFVTEAKVDLASEFYRLEGMTLNVIAKGPQVPGNEQQINLSGNTEIDMQAGRMKIPELMLQAAGVTVTGNVAGNNITGSPDFNGRLTVKQFNPRSVMQQLEIEPPKTSDSSVLTTAGFDTQFEATLERAELKQILIQIDDSQLKGDASVTNFDSPAMAFRLNLDKLNVDRYLAPESDKPKEKPENPQEPVSGEISLDILKGLKLDGRITAERLTASNLKIEDAELSVTARNGVLRVEPLGANLYNGNLRMQAQADAAGKRQTYRIKGDLNGLNFGPLLKDLVGSDKLDAAANMKLDLTTAGNTVEDMKRALDGSISFEFLNGKFNGFDLAKTLEAARAAFRGQSPAQVSGGETPFSRFAASFSVNDGLLSGQNLNLDTNLLRAQGGGNFNIVTNVLDYLVNVTVPESSSRLEELRGVTIPIKLNGPLLSPDYKIDMAAAARGVAEQRLQEEKAKVQDKIDEKKQEINKELQDKVRKGISDFLGGGDKSDDQSSE